MVVSEAFPDANDTSTVDQRHIIRERINSVYKATGRNRIGSVNDTGAVIDIRCRAIGVESLRVLDASASTRSGFSKVYKSFAPIDSPNSSVLFHWPLLCRRSPCVAYGVCRAIIWTLIWLKPHMILHLMHDASLARGSCVSRNPNSSEKVLRKENSYPCHPPLRWILVY